MMGYSRKGQPLPPHERDRIIAMSERGEKRAVIAATLKRSITAVQKCISDHKKEQAKCHQSA